MAAAAVPRSRGVAGGLYFLFTLMCLVCLASSLIDKDKLEEMKKNLQETQQELDIIKAQRHAASELMDGSMGLMDPLMAFLRKTSGDSPDDSLPLVEYMENIKSFMEKTKTLADGINRETDVGIEKTEKELGKMNNLIKALEEYQAEL
ncbi:uncharacterized protein LOC144459690 isoform X2 [Epinephelus lanceolatus]